MHVEHSTSGPGRATFSEVTVASFAPSTGVRTGGSNGNYWIRAVPPVGPSGRFPREGGAFRILSFVGGPPLLGRVPDSRFPIELATFEPSGLPPGVGFNATTGATVGGSHYRGVPPSLERSIEVEGVRYTALAWIGPDASDALRAALAQVISSPRFPRLRPGTMVNNFEVLRTASHYLVGSFTRIHAPGAICHGDPRDCVNASAPFSLIHAPGRLHTPDLIEPCETSGTCHSPGAFYAIGWTWQSVLGGHRSRCQLRLDLHNDQFYCTNLDARWDRLGRVIRRPADARFGDALQFAFAKVASDGQVVFLPGLDENPPLAQAAHLLWPDWNGS